MHLSGRTVIKNMMSREVPFTGGKSLLYSWGALNRICDKYGVETFGEFDDIFLKGTASLKRSDIVDLIQIGLERRDKKGNLIPIPTEEVSLLIEKYMDEGHTVSEIYSLIIGGVYSSLLKKPTKAPPQGEATGEMTPNEP